MTKPIPSLDDWLTVAEAAEEAGITTAAIHNAIERGRLEAAVKADVKLIHRTEFDRYRKANKRGRPTKATEGPAV